MIKIVYTQMGGIIGEVLVESNEILALKNPRIMQMIQTEEGKVKVNIVPMLGQPKYFEIDRGTMNYDVNDEKLINAYKENVSVVSSLRTTALVDVSGE